MGYTQPKSIRVDLAHLGNNNGVPFFVDIKNPKMMSLEEQLDLAAQSSQFQEDGNRMDAEKKQKLIAQIRGMISSWNLTDMETDAPVSVEDPDAFKKTPGEVVAAINKAIVENAKKASDEQKNLSGPSGKSSVDGQQHTA